MIICQKEGAKMMLQLTDKERPLSGSLLSAHPLTANHHALRTYFRVYWWLYCS